MEPLQDGSVFYVDLEKEDIRVGDQVSIIEWALLKNVHGTKSKQGLGLVETETSYAFAENFYKIFDHSFLSQAMNAELKARYIASLPKSYLYIIDLVGYPFASSTLNHLKVHDTELWSYRMEIMTTCIVDSENPDSREYHYLNYYGTDNKFFGNEFVVKERDSLELLYTGESIGNLLSGEQKILVYSKAQNKENFQSADYQICLEKDGTLWTIPNSNELYDISSQNGKLGPFILGTGNNGTQTKVWVCNNGNFISANLDGEVMPYVNCNVVGRRISNELIVPLGEKIWCGNMRKLEQQGKLEGKTYDTLEVCDNQSGWQSMKVSLVSPDHSLLAGTAINQAGEERVVLLVPKPQFLKVNSDTQEKYVVEKLNVAILENSFLNPQDNLSLKKNWIDVDEEHFHIRVYDPTKAGNSDGIRVRLTTKDESGEIVDGPTEIQLMESESKSGIFDTIKNEKPLNNKGFILVSNDGDNTDPLLEIKNNQLNDQVHKVVVGGTVEISYNLLGQEVVSSAQVPAKGVISISAFILRDKIAGIMQPVRSTDECVHDLEQIKECYAQVGIRVEYSFRDLIDEDITGLDLTFFGYLPTFSLGGDTDNGLEPSKEMNAVGNYIRGRGYLAQNEIALIYVTRLNPDNDGLSLVQKYLNQANGVYANDIYLATEANEIGIRNYTPAHEVLHILLQAIHKDFGSSSASKNNLFYSSGSYPTTGLLGRKRLGGVEIAGIRQNQQYYRSR